MQNKDRMQKLIDDLLTGDRRAGAIIMKIVDDREAGYIDILKAIYPHIPPAPVVGIAGAPGCGKSTIINCLIRVMRGKGLKVGVVAIDPSSSISGGAILGDRIRMQDHFIDDGVFIRSVGTRGGGGGISPSTIDICRIMKAMGMDEILVETVGLGQHEVDIQIVADVVVVVLSPDTGDSIQIMKAGIMEIADIFVVNKMDREGGVMVARQLEQFLAMEEGGERPPVIEMIAKSSHGARELFEKIQSLRKKPIEDNKIKLELLKRMEEVLTAFFRDRSQASMQKYIQMISSGVASPYDVYEKFAEKLKSMEF